jgi:hypothetical protein
MSKRLADELARLCCAETEGEFFDCVTDNVQTIIDALRAAEACTPAQAAANPSREQIARIIDPTAKFYDLEGVSWSRQELERRDLA